MYTIDLKFEATYNDEKNVNVSNARPMYSCFLIFDQHYLHRLIVYFNQC